MMAPVQGNAAETEIAELLLDLFEELLRELLSHFDIALHAEVVEAESIEGGGETGEGLVDVGSRE